MRSETEVGGYYIEVALEEGELFYLSAHFPHEFSTRALAEEAANGLLSDYGIVRVCREEVVFRRDDQHQSSSEVVSGAD